VSGAERGDNVRQQVSRDDRLDAELGYALLSPPLPDRRVRPFTTDERPGAGRAPGATLVLSDRAGACFEDGCSGHVEGVFGSEPDELEPLAHSTLSI